MIALWYWASFFVSICLQHLVSVSHSSIPTERKTAGLQLLLDLQETFLHSIYDNPFNYATSDRVSVLLRQRNIRKILKSQAKSRQMPQNIHETECRKKEQNWVCLSLVGFMSVSTIYFARLQMEPSATSHITKLSTLEFRTFIFPCQRRNRIFIFALFSWNSLPVFDIRWLFIGINVLTFSVSCHHNNIISI